MKEMAENMDKSIREVLEGLGVTDDAAIAPETRPETRQSHAVRPSTRRTRIVDDGGDGTNQTRYAALNAERPCWVVPGQPMHAMEPARAQALREGGETWREWCKQNAGHDHAGVCVVCTPSRWLPKAAKVAALRLVELLMRVSTFA